MPELPEVENVCQRIKPFVLGRKITNCKVLRTQLRYLVPANMVSIVIESTVIDIQRKAKYILICLSNKWTIVIHLGMAGSLRVQQQQNFILHKHDHVIFTLNNNYCISFRDPRCFGFVDVVYYDELEKYSKLSKLGPEPLTREFNVNYLCDKLSKSSVAIKTFLLNQHIVSGIGNIYASEILFLAKINPQRLSRDIVYDEAEKLVLVANEVLTKAIKLGGTSIKDYEHPDGSPGNFQNSLYVYNRKDSKCRICGNKIVKIKQMSRATYYCLFCQVR